MKEIRTGKISYKEMKIRGGATRRHYDDWNDFPKEKKPYIDRKEIKQMRKLKYSGAED